MKNQIIRLDEKNRKVFGFNDEQLIFSSKGHSTFDSLLAAAEKPGMLETLKTVSFNDVRGVEYNESDEGFIIKYDKKGKIKKIGVGIKDANLRQNVVREIAAVKGFNESVVAESTTTPLLLNGFLVLVSAAATYIFRGMAVDAQNGEHYVATGRRSGIAQLFANLVESLGPLWVTVIGVLFTLYMIYKAYKRFTNPASEIKYS